MLLLLSRGQVLIFSTSLILLNQLGCKKKTDVSTQEASVELSNSALNLVGNYANSALLGDADFILIRDCESASQCTNDIVAQEDMNLGNDTLSDISLSKNDPGFLQTLACKAKSDITPATDLSPGTLLNTTVNKIIYTCLVNKFSKTDLLNQSAEGAKEFPTQSPPGEMGIDIGFGAGLGMVNATGTVSQEPSVQSGLHLNEGESKITPVEFDQVLVTDWDGTQGLGDYDPVSYGEDYKRPLGDQWEDFCKRKLGGGDGKNGGQGMRELRKKFILLDEPYKSMLSKAKPPLTASEIIDIVGGKAGIPAAQIDRLGLPKQVRQLHEFKGATIETLVKEGYMVKGPDNRFYNTPTFLEGSASSLHKHLSNPNRVVMINSTNFRPGAAELIEYSLVQEWKRLGLEDTLHLRENQSEIDQARGKFGQEVNTSTKTRFKNFYVGTAASLGVRYKSGTTGEVRAGTKVKFFKGDKFGIAEKTFADLQSDGNNIKKSAAMISLDDKPGKAKHFASFADKISAKHIYIQSDAVNPVRASDLTTHIQASDIAFPSGNNDNGGFYARQGNTDLLADGKTIQVTGAKARQSFITIANEYPVPRNGNEMGEQASTLRAKADPGFVEPGLRTVRSPEAVSPGTSPKSKPFKVLGTVKRSLGSVVSTIVTVFLGSVKK